MKNSYIKNSLKLLAACAVLSSASSGFAATTWTPGAATACDFSSGSNKNCGTTANVTSGGVTVSALAYSTTGSGGSVASAALYDYGSNHLGVVTGAESPNSSPEHSMDNNVSTDLISLKFTSSVALTSITTGWAGAQTGQTADSDMSLLAYTGKAGYDIATYDIAGKTIAQLMAQGWTLVANINGGTGAATYTTDNTGSALNASGISSSWWIVSAFNSGYGGSQTNVDGGDDYVKLLSVAGDIKTTPPGNKVPEPGSLALMGAAFCAALATRRRKVSKSV
ncbi:hypothetical protein RD110_17520 [Rhodoferax koreense]|uniref:Ice-binding protein C-terminal domain-containing protein n=1 Tax=Rhodoferax koreensis TaxID=1842727 RepID=A0A1P8JYE7_9BURK|nr:exosortase-dependent surface protein XDP1 [Rhodoferax koreense]APW38782.1 hypothetical protein RD110_17520 [Rhodoferax koreense]